MKFNTLDTCGIIPAIHGMRNPLESWDKSDSGDYCEVHGCKDCPDISVCNELGYFFDRCEVIEPLYGDYILGEADKGLAQRLIEGGTEHRKFLRQIQVWVDITAPLYWWKEFDTYKVGTTANSTSTMHKLMSKPITRECFEMDDFGFMLTTLTVPDHSLERIGITVLMPPPEKEEAILMLGIQQHVIDTCEQIRLNYICAKERGSDEEAKRLWRMLIQILPESWLQTRTVSLNYEVLRNMYHQRKSHKLREWSVDFVKWVRTLPYSEELIIFEN